MAIYVYKCNDCKGEFEIIQKMTDDSLTVCPSCSRDTLQKQITNSSFQLKGSGFYATDFKHKR